MLQICIAMQFCDPLISPYEKNKKEAVIHTHHGFFFHKDSFTRYCIPNGLKQGDPALREQY